MTRAGFVSDPVPSVTRGRMGPIRPFVEEDIPQVARLHRTVFRPGGRPDGAELDSYRAYFTRVFLDTPARDPRLSSLVYEEDGGRITGFVGVVPRRMSMNGQHLQAAISSQFVVDPPSRAGLVAVRLAKAFLDGPQDLSFSDEATDVSRKMWEGLGGTTALLHSLHWTRPLRPARLVLSLVRTRGSLAPLAVCADPLARIVDWLATRIPRSHLYQARPPLSSDDLREETFLMGLPEFAGVGSLRVEYDDRTFRWQLERAEQRKGGGHVHKAVIRNGQTIMGWYLYHLDRRGIADVLQIAATPDSIREVLAQLFYQAWRQGALAVSGRVDPRFLQALSDTYCLFHRRGPWLLIHARKPELLQAFQNGDVFLSRFDGEWCLGFPPPMARSTP